MKRLRIATVVLSLTLLAGCNGGSSYSSPTSPTPMPVTPSPGATSISIVGMSGSQSYSPNPANAKVGQSVQWRNMDTTLHHIVADNGAFDTGDIASGYSGTAMVAQPGSYPYHCSIHPTMVGTLNVQ